MKTYTEYKRLKSILGVKKLSKRLGISEKKLYSIQRKPSTLKSKATKISNLYAKIFPDRSPMYKTLRKIRKIAKGEISALVKQGKHWTFIDKVSKNFEDNGQSIEYYCELINTENNEKLTIFDPKTKEAITVSSKEFYEKLKNGYASIIQSLVKSSRLIFTFYTREIITI